MFKNIGKKIKVLAVISFIIGTIASIAGAVVLFVLSQEWGAPEEVLIASGIMLIIIGPLVSWIGSFLIYGYGELIQKTSEIEKHILELKTSRKAATNNEAIKNTPTDNKPIDNTTQSNLPQQAPTRVTPEYPIYNKPEDNLKPAMPVAEPKPEKGENDIQSDNIGKVASSSDNNRPVSFFCSGCGTKLTVNYSSLISKPSTFCHYCGNKIDSNWVLNHFAK